MTFPAGSEAVFNLVVRGLAFQSGHLLVSRWVGSYCFPIGGRLQHGESLEDGVRREFLEETGVEPVVRQLVYFHENFFAGPRGQLIHELGWYFWVETPGFSQPVDKLRPHPDHPDLRLAFVPIDRLESVDLRPGFLIEALPRDHRAGFHGPVRRFVTREA